MEIDGTAGIQDDAVVRENDAGGQLPPPTHLMLVLLCQPR